MPVRKRKAVGPSSTTSSLLTSAVDNRSEVVATIILQLCKTSQQQGGRGEVGN